MKVRVRFFARFRELFGPEHTAEVEEGTSVATLLQTIARDHPEGRSALFDENGAFRSYVILMHNGERIETSRAGDIQVSEGDEVAVFPPVAGG